MASDRIGHARALRWALCVAAALAVGSAGAPGPAWAQPSAVDRETARSLMTQGDQAYDAKDFPAALKAYQAAHAIMHLPSTGIWVAKSQLALGMLVEARDMALEVKGLPKQAGEKQAIVAARKEATDLADALAGRIPSIQVQVDGASDPAAVQLTIDGAAIPTAAASAPRKVNPGKHTVTATAPGFAKTSREVVVKEGEQASVTITLEREAAPAVAPAPPPPSPPVAAPAPTTTAGSEPPAAPDAGRGRSPLVYIGFIAGGVGLGVGTVTGIMSLAKAANAKDDCDDDGHCAVKAGDAIRASRNLAWVSNIGFGVGIAGVAMGFIGLLTGGKAPAQAQGKVSVVPIVGPGSAGFSARF